MRRGVDSCGLCGRPRATEAVLHSLIRTWACNFREPISSFSLCCCRVLITSIWLPQLRWSLRKSTPPYKTHAASLRLVSLSAGVLSDGDLSEPLRGAPGPPGTCTSCPGEEGPRESSLASHPTCLPPATAHGGAGSFGNNRRRAEGEGRGVQILKAAVAELGSSSDLS